jgi:Membrane protease subunits, stomatin/prohibitin homologs
MQTVTERRAWRMSGFFGLFLFLAFIAVDVYVLRAGILANEPNVLWFFVPFTLFSVIFATGLTVVQPNEARVLVLFGSYTGSIRESGFYWVNPLASKRHISLRIRNFNSEKIKVNDLQGNPIESGPSSSGTSSTPRAPSSTSRTTPSSSTSRARRRYARSPRNTRTTRSGRTRPLSAEARPRSPIC